MKKTTAMLITALLSLLIILQVTYPTCSQKSRSRTSSGTPTETTQGVATESPSTPQITNPDLQQAYDKGYTVQQATELPSGAVIVEIKDPQGYITRAAVSKQDLDIYNTATNNEQNIIRPDNTPVADNLAFDIIKCYNEGRLSPHCKITG